MVKVQKSSGRKSSHCRRRQSGGQAEMEDDQFHSETQHATQEQPQGGDQSSDQAQLRTTAQSENGDQTEMPMDFQDSAAQAKRLWKPIPPLLPEPDHHGGTTTETRDQSCQTEEQLQQTSASNYSHNTGVCTEPGDPPLLQQPLHTSKSGIQQIIECFRSGTSQLRHMLLKEVDTIFECRMCRSLFRGLPNLITHKEYYCLSRLPDPDGSSGEDRQSAAMKDLLDAIYPRAERPDFVVRLEPIQTTTKAVFQYLSTEDELTRYPSRTASARQSPVAWEGEAVESGDQANQRGATESHGSPAQNQGQRRWEGEEETKDEPPQPEDEGSTSGVDDVTISCCLCGQDFNSRRSIRRHCRKMHQTKLEELRKFTETRTVPTSLLSMVKGRPRTLSTPTGKSCPVCLKSFATKANVRRHFDEVHRGLRRDTNSPGVAPRPGQPLPVEATPPKKSSSSSPTRGQNSKSATLNSKPASSNQNQAKPQSQPPATPQANPVSCRCTLCKRNYSSQLMLKRHMRIVHKVYSVKSNRSAATQPPAAPAAPAAPAPPAPPAAPAAPVAPSVSSSSTNVGPSNSIRVKEEAVEPSDDDDEEEDSDSSSAPSPSDSTGTTKGISVAQNSLKVKEEEAPQSPKTMSSSSSSSSRGGGVCSGAVTTKIPKLSVGFDFKQLFCKLCKRQFSSRQNLTKHIELHTDGNDIFIKFYRCPLCRYESRRKRDVLRHVTVVHKKSSTYLAKIMPKLESRAVKRLAEAVLNSSSPNKRTSASVKEEVNGRPTSSSSPCPSPPVTRKQEGSAAAPTSSSATPSSSSSAPPTAPATRKQQDVPPLPLTPSPPVTRKQERQQSHQHRPTSPPLTRRSEKHTHLRNSSSSTSTSTSTSSPSNQAPHTRRHDAQSESSNTGTTSTEVRVTKNFSLHACDQCGRAFAKKLYLESHKRSHRNATTAAANKRKGVSTRSKSLIW
ncbi:zinc finger protein 800b isoform X1 [Solea solea]|uniref:zinc finger protein 800b isoform X1 n=2 Tax=Solea solea TaxID=90069 RepID=UPI00272A1122|nr:zinc finger protein 800b isoform X1 [Solea solea]XP_058481116.1 zinc finger protein 800b isoform X1 [Solea solea]XP_058481117.1 zinc finger protein 800b isoform X1 [Solea solea]XP_058481118.1 zinc finger protein 800b isoform X1 [Solea solea]XP_058481120.1 zinc finger protein 800b isoform X1 [Solea solea]XP_058481121.1 zinc finger protein 800b isoform X1 [Solea solea]XP_058481122.1 zinc finger protein 800b isoform X1 [Solea solea]